MQYPIKLVDVTCAPFGVHKIVLSQYACKDMSNTSKSVRAVLFLRPGLYAQSMLYPGAASRSGYILGFMLALQGHSSCTSLLIVNTTEDEDECGYASSSDVVSVRDEAYLRVVYQY